MTEVTRRIQVGDKLQRAADISPAVFDRKTRVLRMAFASETPVYRGGEHEILSCRDGDVDLARLKNGAPLLRDHDPRQLLGAVLGVSFGSDGVGRCEAKLSRRCESDGVADDIEDGILQKVSVGYVVTRVIEETPNPADPRGAPFVRYAWKPYEVSLVSIPADDSVGVGRSEEVPAPVAQDVKAPEAAVVPPVETPEPAPVVEKEAETMDEKKVEAPVIPAAGAVEVKQDDVKAERAEIARLGKQHKLAGLAERALVEGWTLEAFRKEAMSEIGKENGKVQDPAIGLSQAEAKRYSFMNVVRALAGERVDIGFERECSDAVSKRLGRSARGLFVPFEVQHQRDLQIASPGTGSNVVATNLMSGSFIEALRAKLALQALGVPVMGGLVGDIAIPKGTTATGYWVDETTAPTESLPVLSQVTGTPRAVGGLVHISRKLMKQSSVDVEGFVRNEIAIALATKIDQAAFNGAGTNEPVGLLTANSSDVSVTAGTPTYAEIANMLATVEGKNVGLDSVKWAVTSEVFWKLATTATSTNGPRFVADYDTGLILGRPAVVSSNVTDHYGFLADWSQMMLLMWGNGLDLTVDPYSASTTGLLKVVGFMDVDIIVRQAAAFAHADICS
jgi:HK97 family phage major capsid protein